MAQGLTKHRRMETLPHKKAISTGTLTRIVTNIMEQNKASLKIFFLQLVLLLLVFPLFALVLDTHTQLHVSLGSRLKP